MITGPIEISNLFNQNVVSMGPKIDAKGNTIILYISTI